MLVGFWFGVIAVLWAGFFMLEGFDFGVGNLLPFMKDDAERGLALRAIGPFWDGNEVWLLVAGGATFAAFPEWYATMFSGFYLAFALLLVGLILRGIGIEYRGKVATVTGRSWCDAAVVIGSFIPALLLGVAFANLVRGVQLDANHNMTNSFWSLLNPYALLGGLTTLALFVLHGAIYLWLRVEGPVSETGHAVARRIAIPTVVIAAAFVVWTSTIRGAWGSVVLAVVVALALVVAVGFLFAQRRGWAFTFTAVVTALVPIWLMACLWPDVMPARGGGVSLTAHAASSSHYTLQVMTAVALVFTPIVLAYQTWSYWVFRARVGVPAEPHGEGLADRMRGAAGRTVGA
jgi:cytochrome d ubiquinol oxidase subunit II